MRLPSQFAEELAEVIIYVITGTTNPVTSVLAQGFKYFFSLFNWIRLIEIDYDSRKSQIDTLIVIEFPLGLGRRQLGPFALPLPFRRRLEALPPRHGESLPDWPAPNDRSWNATRRRALSSQCEAVQELTLKEMVDGVAQYFRDPRKLFAQFGPVEFDMEFSADGFLDGGVQGLLKFNLTKTGDITLELGVGMEFLGIGVAGYCNLAWDGGIVEGYIAGWGKLAVPGCGACPSLQGRFEARKWESGSISLSMDVSMSLGCFLMEGKAHFDTHGGLQEFLLYATNPLCFLEQLFQLIVDLIDIPIKIKLGIDHIMIYHSGGNSITLELMLNFFGWKQALTFTSNIPLQAITQITKLISTNPIAIFDALDRFFNLFSLTFLDLTLGHAPINSEFDFGFNNIAKTGKGIEAIGGLRVRNSGFARIGLFGSAFGIDIDNEFFANMKFVSKISSIISHRFALKFDATIKNPIAADLAGLASDVLWSTNVLNQYVEFAKGVSKEGVASALRLQDASCAARGGLLPTVNRLNSLLTRVPDTLNEMWAQNISSLENVGAWLSKILSAKSAVLRDASSSAKQAKAIVEDYSPFAQLHRLLGDFIKASEGYFAQPSITSTFSQLPFATRAVESEAKDAIDLTSKVQNRVEALARSLKGLIGILQTDARKTLAAISSWGSNMRDTHCLLQKMPDLGQRVGSLHTRLGSGLLQPMVALGKRALSSSTRVHLPPMRGQQPSDAEVNGKSSVDATVTANRAVAHTSERVRLLTRISFPTFSEACPAVQSVLVSLRATQLGGASSVFAQAIGARRYRYAAHVLDGSETCATARAAISTSSALAASGFDCDAAIAALRAGCGTQPRWVQIPAWAPSEVSATALRAHPPALMRTAHGTFGTIYATTVELNVTVAASGRVSCSSDERADVSFLLNLHQLTNLTLYSTRRVELTNEEAHDISRTVSASADGMLSAGYTRRWWFDQTPLALDVGPIEDARSWAPAICEQSEKMGFDATGTSVHRVSMDLTPTGGLVKAATSPFASTVAEAGLALRPRATRVAPGLLCESSCAEGLEPQQQGESDDAAVSTFDGSAAIVGLPLDFARCHALLKQDYASCHVDKSTADLRFALCIRAPHNESSLSFAAWLADASPLATNETLLGSMLLSLDCGTFAAAKAQACVCKPRVKPYRSEAMPALESLVAPRKDDQSPHRLRATTVVQERLAVLGFGASTMTSVLPEKACEAQLVNPLATTGASSAGLSSGAFMHANLQEHLTRVFLCATAGVVTFEDPCDASNSGSECTVRGIRCSILARTNRETCLRLQDEPCARGHITVGGGPLRSRRAPQWVRLSRSGDGYRAEPASDTVMFGTSWLAEALVVAGRRYHLDYLASNPNADLIRVKQASTREGGWLPEDESHQTGLQLRLVLPSSPTLPADIDWDATRAQVQALEEAGFSHLKLKGRGERATCDWKPALCMGGGAPIGELIAGLDHQRSVTVTSSHGSESASLTPIANTTSAQLEVTGHDLGLTLGDILRVAVGLTNALQRPSRRLERFRLSWPAALSRGQCCLDVMGGFKASQRSKRRQAERE